MKLSELENRCMKDLAVLFREKYDAREIILYGSAARGDMDSESDIDLFIVLPEVHWQIEKQIISDCFDAQLQCGRVFSAVCCAAEDIQQGPLSVSPLVLNIRRQGLAL